MNTSRVILFLLFASCSGTRGLSVGGQGDSSSIDLVDANVSVERAEVGKPGSAGSSSFSPGQGGQGGSKSGSGTVPGQLLTMEQLFPVGIPGGRCGSCGTGQECCFPTGRCYDLAKPTDCPTPVTSPADQPQTCSANAQCGNGYVCAAPIGVGLICTAAGTCQLQGSCTYCTFPGECDGRPLVCGCDGKNYTQTEACRAKVRIAGGVPCGVRPENGPTACKDDSQCRQDERCCHLSGQCIDRSCATCCGVSPVPGTLPCESDKHCSLKESCFSDNGRCDGPGGCAPRVNSGCNNEIAEVCGCDGKSYLNRCSAQGAGVRIKAKGRCQN